jgi:lysophospholipase L1-like esterase
VSQAREKEDPAIPSPRNKEYGWMSIATWKSMHEKHLKRTQEGKVDLLFLGDSITQGWGDNVVWKKYYTPRNAANYGIGGDTTQNVLWRINNGAIEGLTPKVVVLLIGTNNFGLEGDKPEDVGRGITAIVKTLREKLPQTKVLLLGILPRDEKPGTSSRQKIAAVNEAIAKLDDGQNVRYFHFGDKFLNADGTLPKELMPDFLHLSEKGYSVWAESMEPLLKQLLGE